MANWAILKNAIANVIKTNGNQEITGRLLQNVLNNIISSVGENATFAGVATPSTSPGVPDGPVFYIAYKVGTYSNFSGVSINSGGLYIIYNNNDKWLITDNLVSSLKNDLQAADDELLKRIKGISENSSAYTDPCVYIGNFDSEKDEEGNIVKNAMLVTEEALEATLQSTINQVMKYIGKMRGLIYGIPFEAWNFVQRWPSVSSPAIYVQVFHSNFPVGSNGHMRTQDNSLHTLCRIVTVYQNSDGNFDHSEAGAWRDCSLQDEDRNKLASIYHLGTFVSLDDAFNTAAVYSVASNSSIYMMTASIAVSESTQSTILIFQQVRKNKNGSGITIQYVYKDKQRFTRYINFSATSVTAVQSLQLDGARNLYFTAKGFIGLRDMFGTQVGSGFFLPDNSAIREDAANITTESVGLVLTSYLGNTSKAVLNPVTSARAGVMTTGLYNMLQDHEKRIYDLETQWYGIEFDINVLDSKVTRIGNMDLHRALPIQSKMRGCLLDDNGNVVKYLNPKDWTGEVRDGSRGQVMVEVPMHYRRCETDGTKRRVKMSEYPLPGFLPIPRMYVSAYEATLQRSTNKLCSVVNTTPDYRGGTNRADFDGTHKSTLGKPINSLSLNNARTYARNRNGAEDTRWNCYAYNVHVTLTWLFVVEYATRNAQLPFTSELTAEGFHQGGIDGTFSISFANLEKYFSYQPIIPCGHTDSLGNGTGIVPLHVETDDGAFSFDWNVPRYRGVEVPFGHLEPVLDGLLLARPDTSSAWTAYACSDPANFNSESVEKYRMIGTLPTTYGFVSGIHFGELGDVTTASVGASSSSKFCDIYFHYSDLPTISSYYACGKIVEDTQCGFFSSGVATGVSDASLYYGTRLCFLPAE